MVRPSSDPRRCRSFPRIPVDIVVNGDRFQLVVEAVLEHVLYTQRNVMECVVLRSYICIKTRGAGIGVSMPDSKNSVTAEG